VARVADRWIFCLGQPPVYVPEAGKKVFRAHADHLSYQTTAALNTVSCIAGGTASGRRCPPCRGRDAPHTAGSDATRLDTTMLVSTGSRKRPTDLDQLRWTADARMPVPGFSQ
jgi:hypothetical protein